MKHLITLFFSSLTVTFLCLTSNINGQVATSLIGQDSYGSMCNLGRQLYVIKNKYVVEFLVPIGWQRDNSLLRSSGVEYFYPQIDSIDRVTNISIHNSPDLLSKLDIDSIIKNDKTKYPLEWKFVTWDIQNNPFHSSVPNGKLFLVKDNENNIKESIAYVSSDDYIMTFIFKTSNPEKYNDYISVYTTFLSSIRCSKISR